MSNIVHFVKVIDDDVSGALPRVLSKLNFPQRAKKIGIKINLAGYRKREIGVTTDSLVFESLCKLSSVIHQKAYIHCRENNATGKTGG